MNSNYKFIVFDIIVLFVIIIIKIYSPTGPVLPVSKLKFVCTTGDLNMIVFSFSFKESMYETFDILVVLCDILEIAKTYFIAK